MNSWQRIDVGQRRRPKLCTSLSPRKENITQALQYLKAEYRFDIARLCLITQPKSLQERPQDDLVSGQLRNLESCRRHSRVMKCEQEGVLSRSEVKESILKSLSCLLYPHLLDHSWDCPLASCKCWTRFWYRTRYPGPLSRGILVTKWRVMLWIFYINSQQMLRLGRCDDANRGRLDSPCAWSILRKHLRQQFDPCSKVSLSQNRTMSISRLLELRAC